MSIIARRYAQALVNLAAKDKQTEQVAAALDELADSLAESSTLRAFLAEPKVALALKEQTMATLLERSQVPPLLGKFVRFVTRKRRADLLGEIRSAFHELADARMGRATAVVTAAGELTADQQQALRERLGRLSGGKEVRLELRVDPDVLGGVVARIGSTVWDGSLRNQLDQIQQQITKG